MLFSYVDLAKVWEGRRQLSAYRINRIYHKYKIGLFTKLIEINSNIPSKDKGNYHPTSQ